MPWQIPKFDPAVLAQSAQRLHALATQARAALRADVADRTSRLGLQRDDVARGSTAPSSKWPPPIQQVNRELAAAEKFDKEAAALDRKASVLERNDKLSATAEGEAEDLLEQGSRAAGPRRRRPHSVPCRRAGGRPPAPRCHRQA